jgi:hypothetical protein
MIFSYGKTAYITALKTLVESFGKTFYLEWKFSHKTQTIDIQTTRLMINSLPSLASEAVNWCYIYNSIFFSTYKWAQ